MAVPVFQSLGWPYLNFNGFGSFSFLGWPFFAPGSLDPADVRVLLNLTTQGLPLTLGNSTDGFYTVILPTEQGNIPGALAVPADHITGDVANMIAAGDVRMRTENSPPSIPTNIVLTPGQQKTTITWTNPSDGDFFGVRLLRKELAYPTAWDDEDAEIVYDQRNAIPLLDTTVDDVGLVDGTTYYYALFVRDTAFNWSTTVTPGTNAGTSVPVDATPPALISDFRLTNGSSGVDIGMSWTNPADSDLAEILVKRKPLVAVTSSGTGNITLAQGSQVVAIPSNLSPAPSPGDKFIGADGRLYTINTVNLPLQQMTLTGIYLGVSTSVATIRTFAASNYPADHTDGTTAHNNLAPLLGQAESATDNPAVDSYLYAIFSKDAGGNWNDTVTQGSNAGLAVMA